VGANEADVVIVEGGTAGDIEGCRLEESQMREVAYQNALHH
jgi:hypothetical protein